MKKKLSLTGLIDLDASTIEVGRLLAADYLAIGTLSSYDQEILTFESYGGTTEKLTASITGDIRLANTTTGVVERAASFAVSMKKCFWAEDAKSGPDHSTCWKGFQKCAA